MKFDTEKFIEECEMRMKAERLKAAARELEMNALRGTFEEYAVRMDALNRSTAEIIKGINKK